MTDIGNKETFSRNLNYYMKKANKERLEICKDLGIKYTTFTDWVNGNKYPRIDKIELLANYFGIQKSDLIEERTFNQKAKGVKIPVLGSVAAGIPIEAIEDIIDYEEISEEMAKTGDFFALQIKGDSMEPKFSKGDVVIVRKQSDVESGQIAVVLVNDHEATVKKFVKHEEGISLLSTNSAYTPMFFTPSEIKALPISILGKVVELRAKF